MDARLRKVAKLDDEAPRLAGVAIPGHDQPAIARLRLEPDLDGDLGAGDNDRHARREKGEPRRWRRRGPPCLVTPGRYEDEPGRKRKGRSGPHEPSARGGSGNVRPQQLQSHQPGPSASTLRAASQ